MPILTTYEQRQVREIAGWKAEPPALVVEAMEAVTHPVVKLAERFIPEAAVKDAIELAYQDSEILAHRDEVAKRAGVADVRELRQADLALCDQLAEEFAEIASRKAGVRGAAMGAGALLSMEMSMMYALKTAHTIGYCYGFTPEDDREQEYVFQILLVASAGTMQEKRQAIVNLRSIEDVFVEEVVENLIENQLDALAEQAVEQAAGSSIPLVGLVTQGVTSAAITYHTGYVAKRSFQERWLRTAGKVAEIAPDPVLAHTRLQRAGGVVATCVYWPSFYVSFAVTYPAALLASLLPQQNIAVQGFRDGATAASHDLQSLKDRLREPASAALPPVPMPA